MNRYWIIGIAPLLCSCAAVFEDPWSWMDYPEEQRWVEVHANVQGYEVRFAVPDRVKGSSQRTRSNLPLAKSDGPIKLDVPTKTEYIGERVATFNWDYWWGGFFKDSGVDFFLSTQILYYEDGHNFLAMEPEEWIEWRRNHWERTYERIDAPEARDRFFKNYQTQIFTSSKNLSWVVENNPQLQPKLLDHTTPIGDKHVLYFGFYVDEKARNGLEPDPEWAERRWEMAHKILNTVEITPRPGKF